MRKHSFTVVKSGKIAACLFGILASALMTVLLIVLCAAGVINGILESEWGVAGSLMIHFLSPFCGVVLARKMFNTDKIVAALIVGIYYVLSLVVAIVLFDGATKGVYLNLLTSVIGGLMGYITSVFQWKRQKRYRKRK